MACNFNLLLMKWIIFDFYDKKTSSLLKISKIQNLHCLVFFQATLAKVLNKLKTGCVTLCLCVCVWSKKINIKKYRIKIKYFSNSWIYWNQKFFKISKLFSSLKKKKVYFTLSWLHYYSLTVLYFDYIDHFHQLRLVSN